MNCPVSAGASRLEYSPGLDGLRGLCVVGVLLFHAPFDWCGGGFLAVSTFFTLSGYLITSLLLVEVGRTGTVALASFWERRMRRLGPALWLGAAATLITGPLWLDQGALERLGLDAVSAALFVSNWRFMSPEYAYTKLFSDPSPLQHCWSLAIEWQFYLVFPIILIPVAKRTGTRGLAICLLVLTAVSVAVGWSTAGGDEASYRGYYGPDVRAAEILVGALLACAVHAGWLRPSRFPSVVATALGLLGIAGILVAWHIADISAPGLYRGGFALYSVLSAAVVYATLADSNPVRAALSTTTLVWLGRVSYGAYVFHWPIFLWLDEDRTGLQHDALFALRVGVTLLLAGLSYRFLEEPIRKGRWLSRRQLASAAVGMVALSAIPVVLANPSLFRAGDFEEGAPRAEIVLRYAMFGDSLAANLAPEMRSWLKTRGMVFVGGHVHGGCLLIDRGQWLVGDTWREIPVGCENLLETWDQRVLLNKPDVAVVLVGASDVRDRRLSKTAKSQALGDRAVDDVYESTMRRTIERFRARGVKVVWLTLPSLRFRPKNKELAEVAARASDWARVRRLNSIVARVAADYPRDVVLVDFANHLEEHAGGPFDPDLRSDDGVHFTMGARRSLADWLGPRIVRTSLALVAERGGE